MRAESKSFEEIGAALGITRQGAQYLCRGDGSAEVRVVLDRETLEELDRWRGERSRGGEAASLLRRALSSIFR